MIRRGERNDNEDPGNFECHSQHNKLTAFPTAHDISSHNIQPSQKLQIFLCKNEGKKEEYNFCSKTLGRHYVRSKNVVNCGLFNSQADTAILSEGKVHRRATVR